MAKIQRPTTEGPKVATAFLLPYELKKRLQEYCRSNNVSMSKFVADTIRKELDA